jgi:1-acyl-sn-glycerol-3-phosphate acyltransferase
MRRYPGTVVVEVLDPIPPGVGQEAFFQRLQREVEDATARLLAEGRRERSHDRARDASFASSP